MRGSVERAQKMTSTKTFFWFDGAGTYFGGGGFAGWGTVLLRRALTIPLVAALFARWFKWAPGRSAPRLAVKPFNQGSLKRRGGKKK